MDLIGVIQFIYNVPNVRHFNLNVVLPETDC